MKPHKIDNALNPTIDALYTRASSVIEQARETAYRQINEALVRRNWELGKLIAEEELNGKDRALYGAAIIKGLSKRLTSNYGKGFTKTNLYSFIYFYKSSIYFRGPTIAHCFKNLTQTPGFGTNKKLYMPTPEQLNLSIDEVLIVDPKTPITLYQYKSVNQKIGLTD